MKERKRKRMIERKKIIERAIEKKIIIEIKNKKKGEREK